MIVGYSLPEEDTDIITLLQNYISKNANITVVNKSINDINRIKKILEGKYNSFRDIEGEFSKYANLNI